MLGQILLIVGSILTVFWYGWFYLLAFFPIWFLFGFFWGVAPLIGMIKIANIFTPIQFFVTAILQVLWIVVLRYLLGFLGMLELFPYYMIVGIHTGLLMNANDLRAERLEYGKSKNDINRI